MSLQGSAPRGEGSARALRPSKPSADELAVENARLRRETARLQALCDQQETNLLRLTQAMWQLRREALARDTQARQEGSRNSVRGQAQRSA